MPINHRRPAGFAWITSLLTVVSLIAACGGGGGGGGGGDAAPAPPPLSSDASLSSLSVSGATLDPAFSSSVTSYTASVPNSTTSSDVAATTTDSNAEFTINGGSNSTVALSVGDNTITVVVTAENGSSMRTYTVAINREALQAVNVSVDPDRVVLFETDQRSVTAIVTDANGDILTGRTITWSSLNEAVATVSAGGEIMAEAVGTATVRATVDGQRGDTLVTVTPPISSFEDYKAHFPYQETSGQFIVSSDFSATFSQEHLEHLLKTWQFFLALYAGSAGTYTEMYYTRDLTGLYTRIIATCPTTIVVGGRNLTACFDSQDGVYIWFVVPYIEPDFGTQLHEIAHSFLYFTQFDSANWPWFNEGISMYWESGSFDTNGSYGVAAPLPYLTSNFRRASDANALVTLPTLFQLDRNQFYGDPDPAKLYSQAGMLLYYLFKQYPAVAQAVIESINNGQIASNSALIDYILQQTGLTIDELETNYTQYALQF